MNLDFVEEILSSDLNMNESLSFYDKNDSPKPVDSDSAKKNSTEDCTDDEEDFILLELVCLTKRPDLTVTSINFSYYSSIWLSFSEFSH